MDKLEKVTKNIAIATEYTANFFKSQSVIFEWYVFLIGFLYFCGIYKNTRMGYFLWNINEEWTVFLQDMIAGENSQNFLINMIFITCTFYISISVCRYFCSFRSHYDKYILTNNIIASLSTIQWMCLAHGQISIDDILGIVIIAIILEALADALLRITDTKKAIYRIGSVKNV